MTSGARNPRGRSSRWWLAPLVIAFAALAVRAVAIGVDSGYEPRNDAYDYHRHAVSIAAGDGYPDSEYGSGEGPTALRPPAYPVVLGAVYAVSGDSVTAGRLAGAVLGGLTALLVFFIAAPLCGRLVALVAAGIVAVFPPLVGLSTELYSENLFIPLMLAAVLCSLRYRAGTQLRWAVGAGVACGLALLTRNVGLALLVPLVLVLVVGVKPRSAALAGSATMLGCVVLALVPWTLRNAAEFDRFIPVAASSGVTLAGVYNDVSESDERYPAGWRNPASVPAFDPIFGTPGIDEATLDAELRGEALGFAADHPGYVAEATWHNLLRLFLLEGGSVVTSEGEVAVSGIGNRSTAAEQAGLAIAGAFALLGLLAILVPRLRAAGGWRPPSRDAWILVLFAAVLILASAPINGLPRHRLPADPFLVILAAVGVVYAWQAVPAVLARWRRRRRGGATAAAATLVLVLALVPLGCDDDDAAPAQEPSTSSPPQAAGSISKAEYVERANAICGDVIRRTKRLRNRIQPLEVPPGSTPIEAIAEGIVKPGLEIRSEQAQRLRALPRPSGDNEALDTYLGLFDVTDELLRERLELGREGSVAEAQDVEALIAEAGDEQRLAAEQYGIDRCAVDLGEVLLPPSPAG